MLINIPPIISLNQCTPESNRPITINNVNATISHKSAVLKTLCFKRWLSWNIAVDIIHKTSIVVDDGYETSKYPSMSVGRKLITTYSNNKYTKNKTI